jgi:hypothetical protein
MKSIDEQFHEMLEGLTHRWLPGDGFHASGKERDPGDYVGKHREVYTGRHRMP